MRTILFFRFVTPSAVLGGKYSKENQPAGVLATRSEILWSSAKVARLTYQIAAPGYNP